MRPASRQLSLRAGHDRKTSELGLQHLWSWVQASCLSAPSGSSKRPGRAASLSRAGPHGPGKGLAERHPADPEETSWLTHIGLKMACSAPAEGSWGAARGKQSSPKEGLLQVREVHSADAQDRSSALITSPHLALGERSSPAGKHLPRKVHYF